MKVLHFFKTYYPDSFGGIEQVIYQLAKSGHQLNIEAEVLSLSPHHAIRDRKIDQHLTHTSKQDFYVASTGFSRQVFRDFKELAQQADIIHYHFPWPFMDLVHFATRLNKPTVLSYHSDVVKQKNLLRLYRPLMNRFLHDVDAIVAASPNYVQTSPFLSKLGDKVSVIPYGLDRASYPTVSSAVREKWRARLGGKFFLFIGAFRYYKGLHILLEAMAGLDYPLAIIGGGALEAELKAQVYRLELKNVHFLGALPDADKHALLELCYSVVLPSHLRSEAFGIALLEGAMYGKPLISSEIGTGTSYINLDKQTGLVIDPDNTDSLKKALITLWEDSAQAQTYGANAQQRYQMLFTAHNMSEKYACLYQTLLEAAAKK